MIAKSDSNNHEASNEVKLSDELMSGFALVSKKAGASNSAMRFAVLTSNQLSCYKKSGIGPSPTDVIEV